MAFAPAPPPKTELGRYRLLSPSCGLRVSPLALGTMSLGQAWARGMGGTTKEEAFAFLDEYYEAGGNFIDTANMYHEGESEALVGEWMETRGNRDEIVVATKYTAGYLSNASIKANYTGNSIKSMRLSVDASLKKLRTSYIDIFYVHWIDYCTPIEEIMLGLNQLVQAGKVMYLGISDTPAWLVSQMNQYAQDHALAKFVVFQGRYNAIDRDLEREIIPMARAHDMAVTVFSSMGGGKFKTPQEIEEIKAAGGMLRPMGGAEQTADQVKISEALAKIAKEIGADSAASVALIYALQKAPYMFPIVGGRKVSQLRSNINALKLRLSLEQMAYLEESTKFDLGFPHNFIGTNPHHNGGQISAITSSTGNYAFVQGSTAILAPQQ
ncbi:Aldo/keto reductase [Meredithblackwellia eburnea MCA 4105]